MGRARAEPDARGSREGSLPRRGASTGCRATFTRKGTRSVSSTARGRSAASSQQERPDIVHVEQEPESINLLQFSLLKARHHFPLVFVAWEDHNPLQLGWGFRKVNYALADAGIFGNQVAMDRAVNFGFHKKMDVIPQYGFEITYDGQSRPDDGRFVVGYAGRLVPEKGVLTLVEATRFMPQTEVLSPAKGRLPSTIRHEPHVNMLGWVPRTEMASFWSQLDVMVLAIPDRPARSGSSNSAG